MRYWIRAQSLAFEAMMVRVGRLSGAAMKAYIEDIVCIRGWSIRSLHGGNFGRMALRRRNIVFRVLYRYGSPSEGG